MAQSETCTGAPSVVSERHPTIQCADVFAAFLDATDETAAMSETTFGDRLWRATQPR
jgi:hypothetical protein